MSWPMMWIMRLAGLVLALSLTVSTVLAFPVGPHHGITPIHCTWIGLFLLYGAAIVLVVEGVLAFLARPAAADRAGARGAIPAQMSAGSNRREPSNRHSTEAALKPLASIIFAIPADVS